MSKSGTTCVARRANDCVEGLKRFNDKHFDLAIVDPPYGLNVSALSNYGESGGTDKRWNTSKKDFYKPKDWDKATLKTHHQFLEHHL